MFGGGGSAPTAGAKRGGGRPRQTLTEQVINNAARSMARSVGTQVGHAILRNVLGGILKR